MKRLTALLLALALLLAGCGGDRGTKEGLLYEASGIDPGAALLTVDGRKVPAGRYLYWLAYTCDYITGYYAELDAEADWEEPLSGETLGDYAKRQALQNTVLYATVENWADRYGCQLTDEDRTAIAAEWDAKAETYGGEEAYQNALARMGLDRDGAEALSADYYLYRRLFELYDTEGSALHPEETAVEAYAAEREYVTASWLHVPAGSDPEAARAKAAEAFAALNESADPANAFASLTGTYGTGDSATFAADAGLLPESCESAVRALSAGQWSGIVEAADGFYILLRRPLDLGAVSGDYFDHLLQTAADNAAVELSKDYGKLTAAGFCEGLERARAALERASDQGET